jgi:hypothetical protein
MGMMVARIKSFQLNVRIPPELKAMLDAAASTDQRSVASLIEKSLTDHLRARGYVDEAGKPTKKGKAAIDAENGKPAGKRK